MARALIIGGTRFIGRHLVEEFLDAGYEITLFNRGQHTNPFEDDTRVSHFSGDRTSGASLTDANDTVEPNVVVDCVAYFPGEVRMATNVFSDVDTYVFISSGAVYEPDAIPKRENETPLEPCSDEQAVDDSHETYGARKAEGDRESYSDQFPTLQSESPPAFDGETPQYWLGAYRSRDRNQANCRGGYDSRT
jgi:nucleoside-diphosphate-sugar epimerase